MRYLVQVDLSQITQVEQAFKGINIVSKVFDYVVVDVPEAMIPQIKALPGVIAVTPETTKTIKRVFSVDKKLSEFQRLFISNPLTGPLQAVRFSIQADTGKQRIPTSESRKMVGADAAESEGITGKGIKIAVLDTGAGMGVQGRYQGSSAVEGQPLSVDENGHSTHVCTTINGKLFSSIHGILRGVAPDAEIRAIKVLGYGLGMGTTTSILRGIADAVGWGADIVSMSLGGPEEDPGNPEDRIISALTKQGMIFCVAAGNDGSEAQTLGTPGAGEDSLTVAAVDIDGAIAEFSSRGPTKDGRTKPDVSAPGVNILSTSGGLIATMQVQDGPPLLACISGTSMATPHVSGVVALALQYARSQSKTLTTADIKKAMALYGDYPGKRLDYGWGLISYPLLRRYINEKL